MLKKEEEKTCVEIFLVIHIYDHLFIKKKKKKKKEKHA